MNKRHGKVAWRCIYLTHDTCFSLCRVDLDSGTGFPVCCRKRRKDRVFALCFFRAQLFRFYTRSFIFVPHAFFLRLASAIERKKRGRPPLHIVQIYSHAHIRLIMKWKHLETLWDKCTAGFHFSKVPKCLNYQKCIAKNFLKSCQSGLFSWRRESLRAFRSYFPACVRISIHFWKIFCRFPAKQHVCANSNFFK
jgi:hypothetical protein